MSDSKRIETFEAFWPYYLGEHRDPICRALHFAGTTAAIAATGSAFFLGPQMLPLALVLGYGPAWVGHFFFEKNRPATFQYPSWSLRADLRMYALMWQGRLGEELRAHGIA